MSRVIPLVRGALTCASLSFLLALQPAAQGQVWVVDDDGGADVDFSTLTDAVAHAAGGDVLLFREGRYHAFGYGNPVRIQGRSLTLIADSGAEVVLEGVHLVVEDLDSTHFVTLRGLVLEQCSLFLLANRGSVWVEECELNTRRPEFHGRGSVHVERSSSVSFNRCTLDGADGDGAVFGPSAALFAAQSSVHVYDCALVGGHGDGDADGAAAARLIDSFLFASGTSFAGGSAHPHGSGNCSGVSGDGLRLEGSTSRAHLLDCSLAAGAFDVQCAGTVPGESLAVAAGEAHFIPRTRRSFQVSSPIRTGESVLMTFQGEPGEIVLLDYGFAPTSSFVPVYNGSVLLDGFGTRFMGVIPPGGQLVRQISILGLGKPVLPLYLQSNHVSAGPVFVRGGASLLVVLDPSF